MELLMTRLSGQETTPEALEIETLVRRTLDGDCRAFEQIVLRYERRVMMLSARLLHGLDEAQDATQEVFLRAFKYLHRLDVRRPVEPWLMRITVNVCRDFQRNIQRRHSTFTEASATPNDAADESRDPYAGFAWEQERQKLWKVLNRLPAKEKMAVILRDVEGFSTAEVAEILGSSESTVRSQICRGRLRIKEAMDYKTGEQS
ncbi:MAG TPA: RNA polymerase sigma factor [Terriglobia bacterium]|nr:RNA polymerase sigma factor [Terriglobia bacterium]